jgi:hypothetical protein
MFFSMGEAKKKAMMVKSTAMTVSRNRTAGGWLP